MKRNKIIQALVAIIMLLAATVVMATKTIPLPDLLKPRLIRVDDSRIYITDDANVYIYSLSDFRLMKKFGKRGEGPQEFMTGGETLGWIYLAVQPDKIFIHSMGKISYYSKKGVFIDERKINVAHGPMLHPMEDRLVGISFPTVNKTRYWTTNIYDADVKIIKELYRYERGYYPGRDIDLLGIKTPSFCVYDKKIFVADTVKTGTIYVFDKNGNKLDTITPRYEKIPVTEADEKRLLEDFSTGRRRMFYEQNRNKIKVPAYFPAMRFMTAADGKLYIMTYKRKKEKTQFLIYSTGGKFLAEVFLPVSDLEVFYYCPYTIKNNTLYHLQDNDDTAVWELKFFTIK
ncbi:MAG: hypothetical protein GY950_12940 [bacterium]|nr:hypothetical protein [bacterium]